MKGGSDTNMTRNALRFINDIYSVFQAAAVKCHCILAVVLKEALNMHVRICADSSDSDLVKYIRSAKGTSPTE